MARIGFGRPAALLLYVGALAVSLAGCVFVPVPAPVVTAPRVIVAPRPVFVPRPVYGYYGSFYGRAYGWSADDGSAQMASAKK